MGEHIVARAADKNFIVVLIRYFEASHEIFKRNFVPEVCFKKEKVKIVVGQSAEDTVWPEALRILLPDVAEPEQLHLADDISHGGMLEGDGEHIMIDHDGAIVTKDAEDMSDHDEYTKGRTSRGSVDDIDHDERAFDVEGYRVVKPSWLPQLRGISDRNAFLSHRKPLPPVVVDGFPNGGGPRFIGLQGSPFDSRRKLLSYAMMVHGAVGLSRDAHDDRFIASAHFSFGRHKGMKFSAASMYLDMFRGRSGNSAEPENDDGKITAVVRIRSGIFWPRSHHQTQFRPQLSCVSIIGTLSVIHDHV